MIRLNDNDSATLATIAQYQQLPAQRKQALVGRLSDQARPIGLILIGDEPENPTEEVVGIAKDFREWTQRNRKSRSSLRMVPAAKAEPVLVGIR
jgi:hypothetical protein